MTITTSTSFTLMLIKAVDPFTERLPPKTRANSTTMRVSGVGAHTSALGQKLTSSGLPSSSAWCHSQTSPSGVTEVLAQTGIESTTSFASAGLALSLR